MLNRKTQVFGLNLPNCLDELRLSFPGEHALTRLDKHSFIHIQELMNKKR